MEVKLFTFEGLKVTLIHNLVLLGALACWVFINVKVLGHDVQAFDDSTAQKILSKK